MPSTAVKVTYFNLSLIHFVPGGHFSNHAYDGKFF